MRALLDVNVLLALFDRGHLHHSRALAWWVAHTRHGWASCPLTQNGFLRIIAQKAYARPVPLADAIDILSRQCAREGHEFWPDEASLLDASSIDRGHVLTPRQLTDIYLLALAVRKGGRLVTFDRGIARAAVAGAEPEHLVVID